MRWKTPRASDPNRVGQFPEFTFSGGGYFFDEVLEYRVWVHDSDGGDDSCFSFASYDDALAFANREAGAEEPLVLILQNEWLDEPTPGQFIHKSGERLTEWRVEWLEGSRRTRHSIDRFLRNHGVSNGHTTDDTS
jgi:hypothetical protein